MKETIKTKNSFSGINEVEKEKTVACSSQLNRNGTRVSLKRAGQDASEDLIHLETASRTALATCIILLMLETTHNFLAAEQQWRPV